MREGSGKERWREERVRGRNEDKGREKKVAIGFPKSFPIFNVFKKTEREEIGYLFNHVSKNRTIFPLKKDQSI